MGILETLLILFFNLLCFWQPFNYYYVSDDIPVSSGSPAKPKEWYKTIWYQFIGKGYYIPKHAHIIRFCVHTINCILIYWAFGHNTISLMASLLFTVNPINAQGGSLWVSGKPYSSATTMVLFMYLVPITAPLFYWLTTFFSASAMLSPLAFILTPYWWWTLLPVPMYFLLKKVIMRKWQLPLATNSEMVGVFPRKLITLFKTYGYYFRLCIMPYKLGLYHSFLWGLGVTDKYNKVCYKPDKDFWIGLGIAVFNGWYILTHRDMVSFGLLWFSINIAMWCNLITIQQQIGERYAYLANVGLMLCMAVVSVNYPVVGIVTLTYYLTRFWHYRKAYLNDYWLVEYNVVEMPDAQYAWLNKGIKKFFAGNFGGALQDFAEGRLYAEHDFKINYNLAVMLMLVGNLPEAEKYLQIAYDNPYLGVEEQHRTEFVAKARDLIVEIKKTGKIDMNKVQIIK